MKLDKCINILRPIVIDYFKDDYSGHDIDHLERTLLNALYLHKREGGDEIIIGVSAYLHDIHRIMQNKTGKYVSPKESIPIVKKFLKNLDLTKKQVDSVCYVIENHELYNWNNNVEDINTLIVQDADNLDALGPIGIARAFSYGGKNNIPIYVNKELKNNNFSESDDFEISTIHHFYDKLFKLEDNMNTKTAKKVAKKRTKYMKRYVEEFLKNWNNVK